MDGEYEKIVERCAKGRIDEALPNSSLDHAFIGIKHLIQMAGSKVKIVSSYFYEDFWLDLYPYLSSFLNKRDDSNLSVVICDKTKYKNDGVLGKLKKDFPRKVNVSFLENMHEIDKIINFVTIDPYGYRFELSDKDKEKRLVSGIINFGDKNISASLSKTFQTFVTASTPEAAIG